MINRRDIIKEKITELDKPIPPKRDHPIRDDDPVIAESMHIHDDLYGCANEFYNESRVSKGKARQLNLFDQQVCLDAANMIQKLATELTRLRLTIQCHCDTGVPDRNEMRRATKNWNAQ